MKHKPSRTTLLRVALAACWFTTLVPTAPALARQGPDFYVDGNRQVNGTGTAMDPFNTLTSVPAALDSRVYVAGTFRESAEWAGLRRGTIVQQWPGRTQTQVRGDVVVPPTGWTWDSQGAYSTPVNGTPVSVVWNWDSNVDSLGRNFGHLLPAATLQACRTTPGSWYFDALARVLSVRTPSGARPPDQGDTYAWVRNGCGLTVNNGDGLTIDGLNFRLWSDPGSGGGYGIRLNNGIGSVISNCEFQDCGYHSAGFVGDLCRDNQMINCVGRGLRGRSNHFVFYSMTEDVTGCVARDCTAHLYSVLDWRGQPVDPTDRCSGFYAHTGTGGARVRDLEFLRCKAIGYNGHTGNAFGSGLTTIPVIDGRDADSYPIRFVECIAENCDYINVEGYVAFIRCRLDLRRASVTGGLSNSCIIFNRTGTQVAIESSELITKLDGTNATRAIWVKNPEDVLYLMGVTFLDEHQQAATRSFVRVGEGAHASAQQCVFSATAASYLTDGAPTNSKLNLDFHNCWYFQIAPTQYSVIPEINERAEWEAQVDSNGWYDIKPRFTQAPDDLSPEPDGPLWRVRSVVNGVSRSGIAGQAYDGHLGAHQLGWPVMRLVASPCPNGGAVRLNWNQATPGANAVVLYSKRLGTSAVPQPRPCAGLQFDLSIPTLVVAATKRSDALGRGAFVAQAPANACGGYFQIIDLGSCATSNVVTLR